MVLTLRQKHCCKVVVIALRWRARKRLHQRQVHRKAPSKAEAAANGSRASHTYGLRLRAHQEKRAGDAANAGRTTPAAPEQDNEKLGRGQRGGVRQPLGAFAAMCSAQSKRKRMDDVRHYTAARFLPSCKGKPKGTQCVQTHAFPTHGTTRKRLNLVVTMVHVLH